MRSYWGIWSCGTYRNTLTLALTAAVWGGDLSRCRNTKSCHRRQKPTAKRFADLVEVDSLVTAQVNFEIIIRMMNLSIERKQGEATKLPLATTKTTTTWRCCWIGRMIPHRLILSKIYQLEAFLRTILLPICVASTSPSKIFDRKSSPTTFSASR